MNERKIDRFDKYMAHKELNDNRVTLDLGLSIGTLGKSRKEGRDISAKVVEEILNFYIDLNRVWLLTGEGEMLKTAAPQVEETAEMVSMPREVWDVIRDQAASLKAKDKQVEEVIALLKEQINKKGLADTTSQSGVAKGVAGAQG